LEIHNSRILIPKGLEIKKLTFSAWRAVWGVKKITKIGHDKNAIFMYLKKQAHSKRTRTARKRKFTRSRSNFNRSCATAQSSDISIQKLKKYQLFNGGCRGTFSLSPRRAVP